MPSCPSASLPSFSRRTNLLTPTGADHQGGSSTSIGSSRSVAAKSQRHTAPREPERSHSGIVVERSKSVGCQAWRSNPQFLSAAVLSRRGTVSISRKQLEEFLVRLAQPRQLAESHLGDVGGIYAIS